MSDNRLILIPETFGFVPATEAIPAAASCLESALPQAHEIKAETREQVCFIDCGGNFERVLCPHTGREIDMDLWAEAMDRASETDFEDLTFISPHSDKPTTLHDLVYDWPKGFARFSLEAMNPNLAELPPEVKKELERLLGCKLRVIWQHI